MSGQLILASAARTASGTSAAIDDGKLGRAKTAVLVLSITADEQLATDTLDVYVQSSPDGGATWDDFAHFTQALGNAGNNGVVEILSWIWSTNDDEARTPKDGAIAAGTVVNGPVGPIWRVKWVIAGGGTKSFTFSVRARVTVR